MKNQGNVTPSNEHNTFPVTDPKETEIYELPDKEFKIIFLRDYSKLQENTNRQLNKIKKVIHEQNERFNREIEIIEKSQTDILDLKNIMNEMKNAIENINRRVIKQKEESVDVKPGHLELSNLSRKKEKRMKNEESLCELGSTIKCNNMYIMRVPEGEERKVQKEYLKK